MACAFCIARQRNLVKILCKKPDSWACLKAKARLERLTAPPQEKTK